MPLPLAVTVIGATGLVGRHLVKDLARRDGVDVVNVYARSERPPALSEKVEWRDFPELEYFADAVDQPGMLERMARVVGSDLVLGDVFLSCLGTTRKRAGSTTRFRFVDFAVNAAFARAAREIGYDRYGLVSSVGADADSMLPYSRVKGELEDYARSLKFEGLDIYRPGVLTGARDEKRFGESLAARLLSAAAKVVPALAGAPFAPMPAGTLAEAMAEQVLRRGSGEKVLYNSDIQGLTNYE